MKSVNFRFDFVIRHIGNAYVLVPIGENDFNGIVLMNRSSAMLVELLRDHNINDATILFKKRCLIGDDSALKIIEKFIIDLRKGGLTYEDVQ